MPDTFIKIASVTVGSGGAANIDFTSIPSTYTDLCVKLSARGDAANTAVKIQFNALTTNLSTRYLYGSGSSASSFTDASNIYTYANSSSYTASTFANSEIYIPNYASSNAKSISVDAVTETNATAADMALFAGLWNATAAITSIKLLPNSGNFVQYSTATLYGIKNS